MSGRTLVFKEHHRCATPTKEPKEEEELLVKELHSLCSRSPFRAE